MRNVKYLPHFYSMYDHTGIRRHLEKMAAKGWMLEKAGTFCWKYRRIEPKKVHFAVNYFPKASEFAPEPPEEQQQSRTEVLWRQEVFRSFRSVR